MKSKVYERIFTKLLHPKIGSNLCIFITYRNIVHIVLYKRQLLNFYFLSKVSRMFHSWWYRWKHDGNPKTGAFLIPPSSVAVSSSLSNTLDPGFRRSSSHDTGKKQFIIEHIFISLACRAKSTRRNPVHAVSSWFPEWNAFLASSQQKVFFS